MKDSTLDRKKGGERKQEQISEGNKLIRKADREMQETGGSEMPPCVHPTHRSSSQLPGLDPPGSDAAPGASGSSCILA